jgi:hypothetical protein
MMFMKATEKEREPIAVAAIELFALWALHL